MQFKFEDDSFPPDLITRNVWAQPDLVCFSSEQGEVSKTSTCTLWTDCLLCSIHKYPDIWYHFCSQTLQALHWGQKSPLRRSRNIKVREKLVCCQRFICVKVQRLRRVAFLKGQMIHARWLWLFHSTGCFSAGVRGGSSERSSRTLQFEQRIWSSPSIRG